MPTKQTVNMILLTCRVTNISIHENFRLIFNIGADSTEELNKKLTAISRWFKGKGTLIFNDMPFVKWNVRVMDSVSYTPEHDGRKAVLSVTYKGRAFFRSLYLTR